MKVLSIDVGVNNMAYCVLDDGFDIQEWAVLSLAGKTVEANVRSMHEMLEDRRHLLQADVVLIERQMATNVRMCCIASSLLMYYLQDRKDVRYVEAVKKTSAFKEMLSCASTSHLPKSRYKRNKAESIMCARFVLQGEWLDFFEAAEKKDDLSDAMVGAWSWMKENQAVHI